MRDKLTIYGDLSWTKILAGSGNHSHIPKPLSPREEHEVLSLPDYESDNEEEEIAEYAYEDEEEEGEDNVWTYEDDDGDSEQGNPWEYE